MAGTQLECAQGIETVGDEVGHREANSTLAGQNPLGNEFGQSEMTNSSAHLAGVQKWWGRIH